MYTIENNPNEVLEIVETLPPMHPGEILREEFMRPHGLSAGKVAKACHVPRTRIERIAKEEIGITADTAVRLGAFFGTSAQFWLNLQARFEAETAAAEMGSIARTIETIAPRAA